MVEWNGYFYIENLALTDPQQLQLVQALQAWGLYNQDEHPNERNHWRVRPDQKAVIFQAVFDADNLTTLWLRTKLAQIFNVPVSSITATTTNTDYGPLITCRYNNVDRLRCGIFGGLSAGYEESYAAVLHFLADFSAVWNSEP